MPVSGDGHLRATLDPTHSGVILKATYAGPTSTLPEQIIFHRGDGSTVRTGNPAWLRGTTAIAYDHELALGSVGTWYAEPIGSADPNSALVTLAMPEKVPRPVSTGYDSWLKSVILPHLSMPVWLESPPELTRASRNTVVDINGTPYPAISYDGHAAKQTTLVLITDALVEIASMEALVDSGPLLFQTAPSNGFPDSYWVAGDLSVTWVANARDPQRRWTISMVEVGRPPTIDQPLRTPNRTCDQVRDFYSSSNALGAAVDTCDALLGA